MDKTRENRRNASERWNAKARFRSLSYPNSLTAVRFSVPRNFEQISRKIEEFQNLIENIRNSNILVIVEGKKDKEALQNLGINNIVELSKKPLFQIVEEIAHSNDECIILTDLDREGKQIYSKLYSYLQRNGVKINNKFREFLFRNTKLRQIEGLDSYLETF